MKQRLKFTSYLMCAGLLAACAVGPDYERPSVDAPPAFKELSSDWKPATPQDAINRGDWWTIYNDPILNELEKQIDISNQNLKAAEAAYRSASALVDESRATLFPTLSLNGSSSSGGALASHTSTVTQYNAGASGSWDLDVWGRIRRTVESDVANAQASAADIASARLSAQATLATDYFNLRMQDNLKQLLDDTVADYTKALKITQNQYDVGVAAKADVITAQTQLQSTQAQAINVGVGRAQLEHAIAVLIGKAPSELSLATAPFTIDVPTVPMDVPSTLLERRPDIASAERQVAAANAQIGVAISAYFPDLTLSGSFSSSAVMLSKLFQASNSLWSVGPALAETVFDAGAREAKVNAARANHDQTVATYRQTVLTAFQSVEDQLAALRILAQQAEMENAVVESARHAEQLVLNQYKAGVVPYSSVITAQTTTLANEQTALTVRKSRFDASVALIQAMGGGWDTTQRPKD